MFAAMVISASMVSTVAYTMNNDVSHRNARRAMILANYGTGIAAGLQIAQEYNLCLFLKQSMSPLSRAAVSVLPYCYNITIAGTILYGISLMPYAINEFKDTKDNTYLCYRNEPLSFKHALFESSYGIAVAILGFMYALNSKM
jgi:hypothetical protein